MEVDVHAEQRLVCIYLTHADEKDPAVQRRLPPLYEACHAKKYRVSVFHSGQEDLEGLTRSLLLDNRRRAEETRMRQEKTAPVPQMN